MLSKLTRGIYWKIQGCVFYFCIGNIRIILRLCPAFEKTLLFRKGRKTSRLLKLKDEFLTR